MRKIYALLFICLPLFGIGQVKNGSVQGKITDTDKEEVGFASVVLTRKGAPPNNINSYKTVVSDVDGFYRMEIEPGEYVLSINNIGYEKYTQDVTIISDTILFLDILLNPTSIVLKDVIFTESKNPTRLEDATTSISLIKPQIIQARNATSADMAIEQVPGITVVESEPQIRGASGFSSGLGSKVLIMIDDIPMLRGDAGRPVWSFLPLENMDQIEVIKGSGSVLYGSGASNGVINIRTAFPKAKPEFMVSTFFGVYSPSNDEYKRFKTGFPNFKSGANFYHSRVFRSQKLDVDFVVGGQVLWDQGYKGGEPQGGILPTPIDDFDSTRVNEGEYEKSGRINFNTRFRVKKIQGLSFGINANALFIHESQSFFWQNSDTNVYNMLPGSLTNFINFMYYIDPYVTHLNKKGDRHTFRSRIYQSYSDGDVKSGPLDSLRLGQDSKSTTFFGEYQYSKSWVNPQRLKWLLRDFSVILGAMGTYTHSFGGVFSGGKSGDSTNFAANYAGYFQLDKKFFKIWSIVVGTRFEQFIVNQETAFQPIVRVGTNLKVSNGTYLRASWGQGFRFPTIGERYISTQSAGFGFYSNDTLKPETSWSAEVGVKQLFKIKEALLGFLDVAGFWQEYENYVEFAYGKWQEGIGFRFFNTGQARIRGVDATLFLQSKIRQQVIIDVMIGYTYSLPQTLQPDYAIASYKVLDFLTGDSITKYVTYNNSIEDTTIRDERILKYRVQHLGKADINISWKGISVGFTAKYYSTMKQIDNFFTGFVGPVNPFAGLPEYLDRNKDGAWVFDARISYQIKKWNIAFIMDNIFNKEYSVRPLGVAPPRISTLKVTFRV